MNLNTYNSHFSRRQSSEKNELVLTVGGKKKESDCLLVNILGRNKKEQFKLKSCVKRDNEQYEGCQDDT